VVRTLEAPSSAAGGAPEGQSADYRELAALADHFLLLCRRELQQILGPWAEERHRLRAAAELAALAWGLADGGVELPGTVLVLVARFHMCYPLWYAATLPCVPQHRPAREKAC